MTMATFDIRRTAEAACSGLQNAQGSKSERRAHGEYVWGEHLPGQDCPLEADVCDEESMLKNFSKVTVQDLVQEKPLARRNEPGILVRGKTPAGPQPAQICIAYVSSIEKGT